MTAVLPPLDAAPRRAWLAARDPRTRLVAALVLVLAVVVVRCLDIAAALLLAAAGLAHASGASAAEIRHRLRHVEGFVVILLLVLPLSTPGPTWAALSIPGLWRALDLALRLNAAALILLAVIGGLAPIRLGQALAALGAPERLVQILLFAVRYVGLLRDETERLLVAARARGFRPTTSRHTITTLGLILATTLIRALERAERIGEAMRCRGFSGRFAHMPLPRLTSADIIALAATLAFATLVLIGDRL